LYWNLQAAIDLLIPLSAAGMLCWTVVQFMYPASAQPVAAVDSKKKANKARKLKGKAVSKSAKSNGQGSPSTSKTK